MNALEGLKFALANFSTEKEFSFVYKLKTQIITEKEGRNNYHYFNKKSIFDLLKSSFKDNEVLSSINLINEFISQNNFSIKVKIKSPSHPLPGKAARGTTKTKVTQAISRQWQRKR